MNFPETESARREAANAAASGFSRSDLLAMVAAFSVLSVLTLVMVNRARSDTALVHCISNLKAINRAVLEFSGDNNGFLPAARPEQTGELWWWYKEQVKGYMGLKEPSSAKDASFACPNDRGYSDPHPFWQTARFDYGSYPFNGVTLPNCPNIAGRSIASIRHPSRTLVVMEWPAHAPLSWHRSRTGKENAPFYSNAECVVAFTDGQVRLTRIYHDGYNAAYTRDPIPGYDYQYSSD